MLLSSKVTRFIVSSSFVSIVISMCLLMNLFTPGFSIIVKSKGTTASGRYHTCGCKTGVHSLEACCCGDDSEISGMQCLPERDTEDAFTTFIQSLACAGVPDRYTPVTYNISMPEGGVSSPALLPLYYMERLQTVLPSSLNDSPPDKPPKIV